jgi:hypothetical protein
MGQVTSARAMQLLYSVCALALVPWIVILAVIQPPSGPGNGFRVIVAVTASALVLGTIITLLLWRRRSPATTVWAEAVTLWRGRPPVLPAACAGALVVSAVWFGLASATARDNALAIAVLELAWAPSRSGWPG